MIVVDNASSDGTPAAITEAAPEARLIETGANVGFGTACNRGAEAANGNLLVLLNPDAVVQGGFREAIGLPADEGRGWAAWQGLITADGGRVVNTRGGVVHFTGIAWAGGAGDPITGFAGDGPDTLDEPGFVSGACLAMPRTHFLALGGFPREFFLYQEDVDLSLRLRLEGGSLGVEPAARVDHDYEFEKGPAKWRYLERNRWAVLIRTYPAALLVLLAPALLATELALLPISLAGGWPGQKVLAWGDTLRALPRLFRERRAIQARRAISAGEFAAALEPELRSPYLAGVGRSRVLAALLRAYWSAVRALLRAPRRAPRAAPPA